MSHDPETLESVLAMAGTLPSGELPRFCGRLEEARLIALARLQAPTVKPDPQKDELLSVADAAQRLAVSKEFLYRNHAQLPFTRRMGRKLLFSSLGLERYIQQQRK